MGRLESMTHNRLAAVTGGSAKVAQLVACVLEGSDAPCCTLAGRERSSVGFEGSTIGLFSEASLFLCSGPAQVVVT